METITVERIRRVIPMQVERHSQIRVTRQMIKELFPGDVGAGDPRMQAAARRADKPPLQTSAEQLAAYCQRYRLTSHLDRATGDVYLTIQRP